MILPNAKYVSMRKLSGFAFYEAIGSPKSVLAPMVDQSELAFRLLCRKHGVKLAYTPMFKAEEFISSKKFREKYFTTCHEDRPLFVQFCSNDPDILLEAAKMVEDKCDAVDINLGCPQRIARKGNYGAYLMDNMPLIESMVRKLHENLKIPVTCKIRIFPEMEKTLQYAKMLENAGCQLLAVHGRTRDQRGHNQGLADWNAIKLIKNHLNIPIFANGNIRTFEDVQNCLEYTKADGVMSGEGLLKNPALFDDKKIEKIDLAIEYLEICELYLPLPSTIRCHLFEMLREWLNIHVDLRQILSSPKTVDLIKFKQVIFELKNRMNKEESFRIDS